MTMQANANSTVLNAPAKVRTLTSIGGRIPNPAIERLKIAERLCKRDPRELFPKSAGHRSTSSNSQNVAQSDARKWATKASINDAAK
ncbi:hypothetical protein BGZ79_005690 [Entomortierella chlamydospora]|nr:hypothetical protein BGZ79_005690 [Entomortierella chlamydospora]